eukprot:29036-Pelagococcus_subviridis.AAC.3
MSRSLLRCRPCAEDRTVTRSVSLVMTMMPTPPWSGALLLDSFGLSRKGPIYPIYPRTESFSGAPHRWTAGWTAEPTTDRQKNLRVSHLVVVGSKNWCVCRDRHRNFTLSPPGGYP